MIMTHCVNLNHAATHSCTYHLVRRVECPDTSEFNKLEPHSSHDLVFELWRNNKTFFPLKYISLGNYYDGSRHHVFVTWENSGEAWKMTVNGTVTNNGSGLKENHLVPGGGYMTIGQEQDITPGDPERFALSQSVMGNTGG